MTRKKNESGGSGGGSRKKRGASKLKDQPKKSYPLELRLQAVREVEEKKASQKAIARGLGISLPTLVTWGESASRRRHRGIEETADR